MQDHDAYEKCHQALHSNAQFISDIHMFRKLYGDEGWQLRTCVRFHLAKYRLNGSDTTLDKLRRLALTKAPEPPIPTSSSTPLPTSEAGKRLEIKRPKLNSTGSAELELMPPKMQDKLLDIYFEDLRFADKLRYKKETQFGVSGPSDLIGKEIRVQLAPCETTNSTYGKFAKSKKETTMKAFEKRDFIQGRPAADVSDDEIFGIIAKTEADIKGLEGINNKPKALLAKIEEMQEQIKQLVFYVDNRRKKTK